MFERSKWDDAAKTQAMLQTMPLDKQSAYVHIDNWKEFKDKLINDFGSIHVFRREALKQFSHLDQPLQSLQELVEHLVPAIKTLESHIKCVATFHDPDLLYNNTLTSSLNDTIISCIPVASRQFFFRRLQEFTEQDPQNGLAPNIFKFISEDLSKESKTFNNYPMGNEEVIPAIKVEIKPVRTQQNNSNSGNSRNNHQRKFCTACSFKGFDHQHYPLSRYCGITKLSSKEILQILKKANACFTCGNQHSNSVDCQSTYPSGDTKACRKGCIHDGIPVHHKICKHNDESPSITVSKVGSNKTIPMMDVLTVGSTKLNVQYDTGCQISLITTSALKLLPRSTYSLGSSNMINLLAYNGTSEILPATEVKLFLANQVLKLTAIDSNLDSGSSYSFPTPHKWRKYTKCNTTSHSGKISILLGGDNYDCHPYNVEKNKGGVFLLKSRLSSQHIIYGPVDPSSITWSMSKNNINTVNVMSVSVMELQEHLLQTISAEKYLDLSNRDKLIQINKENGIRRSWPTPPWTQSTTRSLLSIYMMKKNWESSVKIFTEPQKEHPHFTPSYTPNRKLLSNLTNLFSNRWKTEIM